MPATSIADGGLKPGDVFINREALKAAVQGLGQIQGKTYIVNAPHLGGGNVTWNGRDAFHPLGKKHTGVKRKLELKSTDGCGAYIRRVERQDH